MLPVLTGEQENEPGSGGRTKTLDDLSCLGTENERTFSQASLALSAFLTKDVTSERASLGGFPGSRQFETLLHSFVGFLFGHVSSTVLVFDWTSAGHFQQRGFLADRARSAATVRGCKPPS